MSAINGDKSRHSINRKRRVLHRAKIAKLLESVKSRSTATGAQATGERRPTSDRSR